ncbi:potassium transporter Kup [Ketogulonicigenium vulgare]|uniref:potassium transporter Kup n=1 Tax=Ketogulonicigenium vulgare TaxID=92945 RepID=UPI00235A2C83|nr:potassium transporter Kup [Ketogulonicigenium vulgare]
MQKDQTMAEAPSPARTALAGLTIGALGVVYGDIGTSPLYAFREAMLASGATPTDVPAASVLGVLSLIIWTLMIIVSAKYVVILLRADNEGEGGTLSLLALAARAMRRPHLVVLVLGICGAALFYGDALITPAVSVLSAVEGIKLIAPATAPLVEVIALTIIIALFAIQKHGTEAVARFFGPIMLVWFAALAAGGLWQIAGTPAVLAALNPLHALTFLVTHQGVALAVLGATVLAVTGAEALYADMGHFGRAPIRLGWFWMTFPALVLNYMGQGAVLLTTPAALENPFYLGFPDWALVPIVLLATLATIIASQAVITGAFSLTRQAVQLRLLPRMRIFHTSAAHEGQIYIPVVNLLLCIGVLALVIGFRSSSALASAYGIAVTGTMVVTSILALIVIHKHWGWSRPKAAALMLPFLAIDLLFFGSNLMKVLDGGYVPLLLSAALLLVMLTWRRGTNLLTVKDHEAELSLDRLITQVSGSNLASVPGTAVFLTATPDIAPSALLHSLKHFRALHAQNWIVTIHTANVPRISAQDRLHLTPTADPRFQRIILSFGYAEVPDVPQALLLLRPHGLKFDIMSTSFILSRRSLRRSVRSDLPGWQARMFIFLSRNATAASDYFRIPAGRVVELGVQMNL